MKEKIFLSSPHMSDEGYEMKYVNSAFETNWIAPLGENVNCFESEIIEYTNCENAVALSSGTSAIHLGLKALGVKEGDYVFCSDMTFSATCNPILYEKAIPVFIDCDESWNMSPLALQDALTYFNDKVGVMPKAVIVVDLYGQSAKWDEISTICKKYNLPILEDAAEALGTIYKEKHCGTFGDVGVFSFNGNKIITTSGGGMAVCHSNALRDKLFFWATQSRENQRFYHHKEIGYNYRMSNICAGIGRGQMKVLNQRIQRKNEIYQTYKKGFDGIPTKMMTELPDTKPTHWLSCMTLDESCKLTPLDLIELLEKENIEARHIWKPMHMQPIFEKYSYFTHNNANMGEYFFKYGICLPSDTKLTESEIDTIIQIIKKRFIEC